MTVVANNRCNKVRLILLDKVESHTILDLDALSGLTEIDLEVGEGYGCNFITKLGVSLKPSTGNVIVPSRTVSINPRYMVSNESEETIIVRQCYLEVCSILIILMLAYIYRYLSCLLSCQ